MTTTETLTYTKTTYSDGFWVIRYYNESRKLHRVDGPCWENSNGHKEWWLNGEKFTEAEHARQVSDRYSLEATIEGKRYRVILEEIKD